MRPTHPCTHDSATGDEGPLQDLPGGAVVVRWRCDGCGQIHYDDDALARLRAEVERLTTRAERAEAKAEHFEGRYETAHASGMWAVDCFRRAERGAEDAKRHVDRLTTENAALKGENDRLDVYRRDAIGRVNEVSERYSRIESERDALRVENERLTRLAQQHDDMAADYRDETLRLRDAVAKVQAEIDVWADCTGAVVAALRSRILAALAGAAPQPTAEPVGFCVCDDDGPKLDCGNPEHRYAARAAVETEGKEQR